MKYIALNIVGDDYSPYLSWLEEHDMGVEATFQMGNFAPKTYLPGKTTVHGPFMDLYPGIQDQAIQGIVIERLTTAIAQASQVGAGGLVCHAHYHGKVFYRDGWLKGAETTFRSLLQVLPEDMTLYLENVYEEDYDIFIEILDRLNHPRMKMCLDVGHVHLHSSKTVSEWIKALGDRISHVHLHNNDGQTDQHLGLGQGSLDMQAVLEVLEAEIPEAIWVLEHKESQLEASMALLKSWGHL